MGETVFPGRKSAGAFRCGAFGSLVNGDVINLGNKVYEFRTSGSAAAGHVQVNVGVDGPTTAEAFRAAVMANQPSVAVDAYTNPIDNKVINLEAHDHGPAGNILFSASLTGATNIIDQTSGFLVGGAVAALKHLESDRYIVKGMDVTIGGFMIPTTLQSPKILSIQVFDATGVLKVCTGQWTASSNRIKYVAAGGTNPAATDEVAWTVRD